ncbi:MAG: permease-like cell division protein FtsX, partial [Gammaproteobacteria bacterium]
MTSPMTWVTRHLQSMFAALGRLLRRPISTLLTTLVIAVALALPSGLWLVVKNARAATGDLATAVQITAYMKVGAPIARADQLARQLRERPEVASVRVIPAEQALKEFPGTVVLITHDRQLVDEVADRVLWVEDGAVRTFDQGLAQCQRVLADERAAARAAEAEAKDAAARKAAAAQPVAEPKKA